MRDTSILRKVHQRLHSRYLKLAYKLREEQDHSTSYVLYLKVL